MRVAGRKPLCLLALLATLVSACAAHRAAPPQATGANLSQPTAAPVPDAAVQAPARRDAPSGQADFDRNANTRSPGDGVARLSQPNSAPSLTMPGDAHASCSTSPFGNAGACVTP